MRYNVTENNHDREGYTEEMFLYKKKSFQEVFETIKKHYNEHIKMLMIIFANFYINLSELNLYIIIFA